MHTLPKLFFFNKYKDCKNERKFERKRRQMKEGCYFKSDWMRSARNIPIFSKKKNWCRWNTVAFKFWNLPPPAAALSLFGSWFQIAATVGQDYEVSDIQCSGAGSAADLLTAKIKRPVGFRGTPLFADDRSANPLADIHCQIRPDPNDPQEDNYFLKVTDFSRCGILKRNVSHPIKRVTRNWFLRAFPSCRRCVRSGLTTDVAQTDLGGAIYCHRLHRR